MKKPIDQFHTVPTIWFDEVMEQEPAKPVAAPKEAERAEVKSNNRVSVVALRDIWCKQLAKREEQIVQPGELAQHFTAAITAASQPPNTTH